MQVKPLPLDISDESPFDGDVLQREQSAKTLTRLLETIEGSFVLSISSPWGTGKTTFLRMWKAMMLKENFPVIYVNAWETDFSGNPLVAMLGELNSQITELKADAGKRQAVEQQLEKFKEVGAKVLRRSVPVAIKMLTQGLINLDEVTESSLSGLAEQLAQDAVANFGVTKKTIVEFKAELSKLAKTLGQVDESPYRPLVVIIDELDRCRPDYAVQTLEVAKHLFSTEGVVFVIAIDRDQLAKSVCQLYGHTMNADGYLRRFIDLEYTLPEPPKGDYITALMQKTQLMEFVLQRRSTYRQQEAEDLRFMMTEVSSLFGFSLREQDQVVGKLNVVLRTSYQQGVIPTPILVFLVCLRSVNPRLFRRLSTRNTSVAEMLSYIEQLDEGPRFLEGNAGIVLEAELVFAIGKLLQDGNSLAKYERIIEDGGATPEQTHRARRVVELVNQRSDFHYYGNFLPDLLRKIELGMDFS